HRDREAEAEQQSDRAEPGERPHRAATFGRDQITEQRRAGEDRAPEQRRPRVGRGPARQQPGRAPGERGPGHEQRTPAILTGLLELRLIARHGSLPGARRDQPATAASSRDDAWLGRDREATPPRGRGGGAVPARASARRPQAARAPPAAPRE